MVQMLGVTLAAAEKPGGQNKSHDPGTIAHLTELLDLKHEGRTGYIPPTNFASIASRP